MLLLLFQVDALRGVGVRQIACGSGHTVVLTTDGEGTERYFKSFFYCVGLQAMIFSHICPIFPVLLLFMKVYTWGRGDDGRLGHGDNGWKYVPRICQSLTGQVVTQVTCGSYHTAAVTGNGDLWTWGGGMYGKLGHGNEAGCSTPKRVEGLAGLVVASTSSCRHGGVMKKSKISWIA